MLVADPVLVRFLVALASASLLSPDIAAFYATITSAVAEIGPFMNEAG